MQVAGSLKMWWITNVKNRKWSNAFYKIFLVICKWVIVKLDYNNYRNIHKLRLFSCIFSSSKDLLNFRGTKIEINTIKFMNRFNFLLEHTQTYYYQETIITWCLWPEDLWLEMWSHLQFLPRNCFQNHKKYHGVSKSNHP